MQRSVLELPAQGADEGALEHLMAAFSVADYGLSPTEIPSGVMQPSSFSFLILKSYRSESVQVVTH